MIANTDIDIDFADRQVALDLFEHVPAVIVDGGKVQKHKTGVYFHDIPSDPFTGYASIDHKQAEDMG